MRLFVALDLPDPIVHTLGSLIATLKPSASIRSAGGDRLSRQGLGLCGGVRV